MKKLEPTRITQIQGRLAVVSFTAGVLIACLCLFAIQPRGEISNSAITIVSELLMLAGALLGVKVAFDVKLQRFRDEILGKDKEVTEDGELY